MATSYCVYLPRHSPVITGKDSDYANNYNYMWAEKATPLSEIGNMNVRFSYNVDPEPRSEPLEQPHYTFGFNMVGAQPYSIHT